MNFEDLFNKTDIEFVDRDELFDTVKREYYHMKYEPDYYKVFSIYGMGGIGKSRLLTEIKTMLNKSFSDDSQMVVLYLSLEILDSSNYLNALIQLRKQISCACPLFDYALLTYWNRTQITKLDDDFIKTLKNQWYDVLNTTATLVSIPLTSLSQFLSIPFNTMIEIVEKGFRYFKLKHYSKLFSNKIKDISTLATNDLIDCLGAFLGLEINRLYCEKPLFIIVDAYQQYSMANFINWLPEVIKLAKTGLFIISSREIIDFSFLAKEHIISYELKQLPLNEAYNLLQKSIPTICHEAIEHILNISECVPIYLECTINTYQNILSNNTFCDDSVFYMYKNRNEIIRKFFSHLNENERDIMLGLSLIQIFNQDIFIMLLGLFPNANILEYNKIRSLTLVTQITINSDFYKVHNVIHKNVIGILEYNLRYQIFQYYIDCISKKIIILTNESQTVMLYRHIIQLIIDNQFEVHTKEVELLLDIFFQIKQTQMLVLPVGISEFMSYKPLEEIYYFTKAVSEEREDTHIRLCYLKNIDFENNTLGKHNKSLRIINGYLNQWLGDNLILMQYLETAYLSLKPEEIREWYYAQTIIFWADHQTIIGNFQQAIDALQPFQHEIQKYSEQENSIFQSIRHMGHIYRFNFFLEEAYNTYIMTQNPDGKFNNSIQEIYIITNICESNCYLNPNSVLKYCFHGLKLGKKLNDSKSLAKIYYSLSIVNLHNRQYKRVRKFIRKSMYYNKKDGYELGLLFPMLVELYLQFSLDLPLRTKNLTCMLQRVQVYGFLQLPISIMQNNINEINKIKLQYEWLDFDKTLKTYQDFLCLLNSNRSILV